MTDQTTKHPIVAAASDIRALLKGVAGVNPTFMTTDDKATRAVRAGAGGGAARRAAVAGAGRRG